MGFLNRQSGVIVFGSSETFRNITITSVNHAHTLLTVQVRGSGSSVFSYEAFGTTIKSNGATGITIDRWGSFGATLSVYWQVEEFDSSYNSQRGAISAVGNPVGITYSATDITRTLSVVYIRGNGLTTLMDDCCVEDRIINSTTLRLGHNGKLGTTSNVVQWQIMELPAGTNVQSINSSVSGTSFDDITISSVVETDSMIKGSLAHSGSSINISQLRGFRIFNSTTVRLSAYDVGSMWFHFYVVENTEFSVQRTWIGFTASSQTYTLTTIDVTKYHTNVGGLYNCYSTVDTTQENIQEFGVTNEVTSSTSGVLTRNASGSSITVAMELIEFVLVDQDVLPSSISSAEAFGAVVVTVGAVDVSPASIASAEAFGVPLISGSILVFGIPSEEFISPFHLIGRGPVNITLTSGISSEEVFGTPTVTAETAFILPTGITTEEAFGIPQVNLQIVVISITSEEVFGLPIVGVGTILIEDAGKIATAEAFGAVVVTVGPTNIDVISVITEEVFGTPVITTGNVNVSPVDIPSEEAFGLHTLQVGTATISPNGIPSAEVFGSHTIIPGSIAISPGSISSEETFGLHTIVPGNTFIDGAGKIASLEAFGEHTVTTGNVNLVPNSISSEEAFGAHIVSPGVAFVLPNSIDSEESFGLHNVGFIIDPIGIPSGEDFGTHVLTTGPVDIAPVSISSEEEFGLHVLNVKQAIIVIPSIPSEEGFGVPTITLEELGCFMTLMETDLDCIFDTENEFADKRDAVYYYKDGSTQSFRIIFDREYELTGTSNYAPVVNRKPMVTCKDRFRKRPTKGDRVLVRGRFYQLMTYEPDGTGVAVLGLSDERTN